MPGGAVESLEEVGMEGFREQVPGDSIQSEVGMYYTLLYSERPSPKFYATDEGRLTSLNPMAALRRCR